MWVESVLGCRLCSKGSPVFPDPQLTLTLHIPIQSHARKLKNELSCYMGKQSQLTFLSFTKKSTRQARSSIFLYLCISFLGKEETIFFYRKPELDPGSVLLLQPHKSPNWTCIVDLTETNEFEFWTVFPSSEDVHADWRENNKIHNLLNTNA